MSIQFSSLLCNIVMAVSLEQEQLGIEHSCSLLVT